MGYTDIQPTFPSTGFQPPDFERTINQFFDEKFPTSNGSAWRLPGKGGGGTLLGTNISHNKGTFEDDFPQVGYESIPWRVHPSISLGTWSTFWPFLGNGPCWTYQDRGAICGDNDAGKVNVVGWAQWCETWCFVLNTKMGNNEPTWLWIVFLGGGNSNIVYFHPENWGRFPISLIFFRWVETTNQFSDGWKSLNK